MSAVAIGLRRPHADSHAVRGRVRPVEISLFGAFGLAINRTALRIPQSEQRLLAFLGLAGPTCRQTAAGSLWPDVTESRAASSLRTVLSKLQHRGIGAVSNGGSSLALCSSVAVDVDRLREVAGRIIAGSRMSADDALQLLDLRGDLLPTWDEEWLVFEREELRQLRLQALECCADRLCRSGDFGPAMMLVFEAVRTEPLRESAHRKLIGIHLAQGNRVQALQAYHAFIRQLWREYRVRPSPLLGELMRGHGEPVD